MKEQPWRGYATVCATKTKLFLFIETQFSLFTFHVDKHEMAAGDWIRRT